MFETWHGRMLLRTGRLSEALAVLEGRFALEDGTHAAAVLDAAGIVALGRLAIHTGDTRQARRLGDIAQVMLEQGTPAVRRHAGWLLALFAMAEGDAEAARGWLRAADRPGRPSDPASVPARHRRRGAARARSRSPQTTTSSHSSRSPTPGGERSSTRASPRSRQRPLTSAVCSSEARPDLREAVDLFERAPRRLELAAALEDLGAELTATDREAAIDVLGRALALYTELGATLGRPPRPQPPARARRPTPPRHRRARDEAAGQR